MTTPTIDALARSLGTSVARRSALRSLLAGAVALVAGSAGSEVLETEAKRRRKSRKKTKKQPRGRRPGQTCSTTQQCRQVAGDYLCASTRLFSAERVCCGGIDALCDETGASGRRCCYGYLCASGRCIVV